MTQHISRDDLLVFARQGAAAQSARNRVADAASGGTRHHGHGLPLAAATTADMQLVTTFTGAAAFATAVATETMHEMTGDVQLVEAFEED